MLAMRLQEEKSILVLEMAQHCTWLQSLAVVLKNKMAEEGKWNKIAIHLKYEFQMKKNKHYRSQPHNSNGVEGLLLFLPHLACTR